MFTIMFQLCSFLLSLFPAIFIMNLTLNSNKATELLYIFPSYAALILFFAVLGNAIHFLISLFAKYTVYIDETTITTQGKRIPTQSMLLNDVNYVIFDQGTVQKYGGSTPSSIILYDIHYDKSLTITNPSFLLICELQKRLKHATFKFNNYKWYIIWSCLSAVFAIIISLFANVK